MLLAESISHALNGRRSGKGFRIPAFWRGSTDLNVFIADGPDGGLIAVDHSQHDDYQTMMQAFESEGLKPKSEFNGKQRQAFIQKKSRRQLMESLFFESHILLQYLNDRAGDIAKAGDNNYLKLHPEFTAMPDEPFERELEAAKQTKKIIGALYGVWINWR